MTISALGANPLLSLGFTQKTGSAAAQVYNPQSDERENSAQSLSILPISQTQPLSFANVLQLQRRDEPDQTVKPPSATDIFLEEARKDPMQRMREQIMEALGVTEEDLAAMAPDERRAMEDKIRQLVEQKLRQGMGVDNAQADSPAEALQDLL
jgi:hypothetical protein